MAQENAAISLPIQDLAFSPQTKLSVEEQILKLIDREFYASTESITLLHQWLDEQRKYKTLGIVVGSHGIGKTIALKIYKNPRGDRNLRSIPLHALYLEIFPGWGIREICIHILSLLNHGDRKGTSKNLLLRTWEALIKFGVGTLIVDHADEITRKALVSLVRLSMRKDTRISLILAGSTQLRSRLIKEDYDSFFESHHQFHALSYVDFANILLEDFAQNFLGLSDPSKIFDDEIIQQLFKASQIEGTESCNFRRLMTILVKAIVKSSEEQASWCINKSILQREVDTYGITNPDLPELPGDNASVS